MHYLAALWDGGGTVPVELGVVRRLVDRGHSVTVLGDPTLEVAATSVKAFFRPWRTAPHRTSNTREGDLLKDWECRSPLDVFQRIRDRLVTGPAGTFAAEVVAELRKRPTDGVLASGPLLGALIGAEAAGVPAAVICSNIYMRPAPGLPPFGSGLRAATGVLGRMRDSAINAAITRMWNTGLNDLNAARAAWGLPALSNTWEQWDRAMRVVVTTAEAFDYPAELPANVRYVGPILDDPVWARVNEPNVDTLFPTSMGALPLIVVALSSTYNQQEKIFHRILTALAGMEVRAIAATGPAIEPAAFAAPNVVQVKQLPHAGFFARADGVVTHGGHGSVLKALAAGVPVLCLPMGRDQRDNAVRAERLGAGLILPRRASSPQIRAAVNRLVNSPYHRHQANAAARRINAEVASSRLVDELEAAAGSRPVP